MFAIRRRKNKYAVCGDTHLPVFSIKRRKIKVLSVEISPRGSIWIELIYNRVKSLKHFPTSQLARSPSNENKRASVTKFRINMLMCCHIFIVFTFHWCSITFNYLYVASHFKHIDTACLLWKAQMHFFTKSFFPVVLRYWNNFW